MNATMRRREFITLLGGAAAWPLAARAQQPRMPVIGFLISSSLEGYGRDVSAFREGLREAGYVEGMNVAIEYLVANNHYDRLPGMAADFVRRHVTLIAAASTPATLAAKAATTTIPIVFTIAADPIQHGLVQTLSRPGNNLTGVTNLNVEVAPKRLELMHELLPAKKVALLINPANPNTETLMREQYAIAAHSLGVQLHVLKASTESEIDEAVAAVSVEARSLVIGADPLFNSRSEQLAALALRHGVPAVYQYREFTAAGGLMSYGASRAASYHLSGIYAGRILKGEKPAELPVQQSTKVELVINLITAKALGITFPITLLGRADEVIE
jgi:putative tryptophan/tyrosine transport system substrate-binding protein